MKKLLVARDVAKLARWHVVTVYKKSAAGEIPGRTKLGGPLQFRESEVEKWLDKAEDNAAGRTRKEKGIGSDFDDSTIFTGPLPEGTRS